MYGCARLFSSATQGCPHLDVKATHSCAQLTNIPYESFFLKSGAGGNYVSGHNVLQNTPRSISGQPKIGWKSFGVTNKRQCRSRIFICAMASGAKSFYDCSVSHPSHHKKVSTHF